MNKFDIFFVNLTGELKIMSTEKSLKLKIHILNMTNYDLRKEVNKIGSLLGTYEGIKRINVVFDQKIDLVTTNNILTKLNDVLYSYYPITKEIKLYQVNCESKNLMEEIIKYKNIVNDSNKNPETYLQYVQSRIPTGYSQKTYNLKETKLFPLSRAVGMGSSYNSYFIHIFPTTTNNKNKTIYLIGKAITFDSGGLNIKNHGMETMYRDMIGSAIIISVLNLLVSSDFDKKYNIHLLIPIVENMAGNTSVRPGMVIQTMNGKTVEINNTDAEGRLCLVDAIEYVNLVLIKNENPNNCLIIDIATLTGNTDAITSGISALSMCNDKAQDYNDDLIYLGERIGEYVDFLKIRKEYSEMLKSSIADIKNVNYDIKAGCVLGGTFIHYFVNDLIPWIHLDVASAATNNEQVLSYGINLLYEFIKNLK